MYNKAFLMLCLTLFLFAGHAKSSGPVFTNGEPLVSNPVRALHIVTKGVSVAEVKNLMDAAKKASFNTIILGICWRGSSKLVSMPWVQGNSAWSSDDLLDVFTYGRKNGFNMIPNVPLLSHQRILLKKDFPQLMYNAQTYDPRKKEVYKLIFPILDELISLLHPMAIHIGHDEVVGWKDTHYEKGLLKKGEHILPSKLFLEDTLKIRKFLLGKGVETWMWGDMLISPFEFGRMRRGGLHGSMQGYGKAMRDKLPKDIMICDWHYFDNQKEFPSLKVMQEEGFRVIGSTWKKERTIKNFSAYAAEHGAYGMMATTWWHVQKKEWNVVDRIIEFSGQTFLKDFPDAK